jgi:hypothetical protein
MLQADVIRSFQSVAGRECASMEPVGEPLEGPARIRHLLRPNGVGHVLIAVSTPNLRRFEFRRCHLDTRIEAARAQIALRAHEVETSQLPESLDQLVPRYLASPPRDYFVGGPIGYERARRQLRAPGSDLESGPACDDGPAILEPCFPLAALPSATLDHAGGETGRALAGAAVR